MADQTHSNALRHVPLIAVAIMAVLGAVFLKDTLSFEALRDNRDTLLAYRDSHYVSAVIAFIALYVAIVAFSLPGATVTTLAGGFLFGLFPGVVFNIIGATIGAICIFLAARLGLGRSLSARMDASEGRINALKKGIDENQWSMLFLIRLVPLVPFFVANLIPALVGVPLWRFAVSTFFGIMPGALVFTSVGSGLGEVFEKGETPDLGIIFEPYLLLPILGLCALALLPVIRKYMSNGDAI